MDKKEYADLGYFCSSCHKKLQMPNLYRIKIGYKKSGWKFQSDLCSDCFKQIYSIITGGNSRIIKSTIYNIQSIEE